MNFKSRLFIILIRSLFLFSMPSVSAADEQMDIRGYIDLKLENTNDVLLSDNPHSS
ncbi:MAG: hypothetical protein IJQ68_04915 [Methanobrevibacter sp.]|uniref:hypothetical protein n=1 Tax=Methanobrevibacter sp. TaxID=66852 RepID=UPI0025E0A83A|nr:hypothetical protein [Methanobrevibacter sp.]MBQ6098930.1 hypothetical protein [Methanobrevibacter sp.]MBR0271320.1 hypothetical protein [Methanobrevibacter sp.]